MTIAFTTTRSFAKCDKGVPAKVASATPSGRPKAHRDVVDRTPSIRNRSGVCQVAESKGLVEPDRRLVFMEHAQIQPAQPWLVAAPVDDRLQKSGSEPLSVVAIQDAHAELRAVRGLQRVSRELAVPINASSSNRPHTRRQPSVWIGVSQRSVVTARCSRGSKTSLRL